MTPRGEARPLVAEGINGAAEGSNAEGGMSAGESARDIAVACADAWCADGNDATGEGD